MPCLQHVMDIHLAATRTKTRRRRPIDEQTQDPFAKKADTISTIQIVRPAYTTQLADDSVAVLHNFDLSRRKCREAQSLLSYAEGVSVARKIPPDYS